MKREIQKQENKENKSAFSFVNLIFIQQSQYK